MPKDHSTKLVGQIGEHLVVAELGRNHIIATPFSGNVPDIDILAYANGRAIPIQVKAIRPRQKPNKLEPKTIKGDWQFDAKDFLEIDQRGSEQFVLGKVETIDKQLLICFVVVGECLGKDRFFTFTKGQLQHLIYERHSDYLRKHNNIRPRSYSSTHTTVTLEQLETAQGGRNPWALIKDRLELE